MKISNLKVNTRLIAGFSIVLCLLLMITLQGIWRLHKIDQDMKMMVNEVMQKERLFSEWSASTNLNGARTMVVAESNDPERQKHFEALIKETSSRITEIQKTLETYTKSPEEARLIAAVGEQRKIYLATRGDIFQEKKSHPENVTQLLQSKLEPALNNYVNSIKKLSAYQNASIAQLSTITSADSSTSRLMLAVLGGFSILVGLAVSTLITSSIKKQLGGEPSEAIAIADHIAEGNLFTRINIKEGDQNSMLHAISAMRDSISGIVKECYVRPTTWTPPTTTKLNSNGYFFARVQVCDRDSTTYALKDVRFWSLCSKYQEASNNTNPIYKPTGTIQKYADQLRLAAFGYVMDQTASYNNGRYGGVLRAPIKYVGTRTFDSNGFENTPTGGNPKQEWDPVTGIFYANPDSNTTTQTADGRAIYLSGVTNYINQFGRTGSVAGRYKKYDPIGELHYQTLRYLQGLQPEDASINSLTTDMYDGYPVFTTWADPYAGRSTTADYSCLKSNIVVIGDKNTHDGNRLPSYSLAGNIPDINAWRTTVQNFEKNINSNYFDGQGVQRQTANPNGANNSVPTGTTTSQIMGSAYWARTHDIRPSTWTDQPTKQMPGLRVKTFMFDVNEYGGSNDANTRRTSNQLFMAAKYGGFETDPANTARNEYNTRGNPFISEADGTNNNYVWADKDTRASRVGEANTYFCKVMHEVFSAHSMIFSLEPPPMHAALQVQRFNPKI